MASGHRYSAVRRSLKLPAANSEFSKRYNNLDKKNKDLKADNETKTEKLQKLTAKVEEAHLATREARKRLDTEIGTMKAEAAKIQEENESLRRQIDEYNIQEAQHRKNALNAEKKEGLQKTIDQLSNKVTDMKNEINELVTNKEKALLIFKTKNQLKEEHESEIADLNQKLKTIKASVPDTTKAEKQFKMAKIEYDREMAGLLKKEKELDKTRTTLECSKVDADQKLETMSAECENSERKAKKKERQFAVWRLEAKMQVNEKENELDDLQKVLTDVQTKPLTEIPPSKKSNRLTRYFNRLLRR
ncbi:uncharacterized protein LOC144628356 isoform X2 [Oculina patagonica]